MSLSLLESASASITNVPAPFGFRDAGVLRDVWRSSESDITNRTEGAPPPSRSLSQKAGLRYERKVLSALRDAFPEDELDEKPWFAFREANGSGARRCQPDAILYLALPIIFEIKLQHTPNAWWQLRKLYEPVVGFLHGRVAVCEITASYDPATPFPEEPELILTQERFVAWARDPLAPFGVWQWKL